MAIRLVLLEPNGQLQVQSYQPALPKPGQIQVRNEATSLNHLDHTRINKNLFINSFPHVLGMDIAGHVADAGTSSKFSVGDYVIAAGVPGRSNQCSYQTHVLVGEGNCAKIGKHIPTPAAANLPFCLATAACGLYCSTNLPYAASDGTEGKHKTTVLIWGANGSVGKLAIQLAKLSGHTAIAVVSVAARSEEVKARSADFVFSNDDFDIVPKIKAVAPKILHAYDTVASQATVDKIARCLAPGGTIATATRFMGLAPEGVSLSPVFGGEVMGKTIMGQDSPRGKEVGQWLWANVASWLESSQLEPLEYEVIGGLSKVEAALTRMADRSAKTKLVVTID